MTPSPQVLIVDESSESREVLCTLLERQGTRTIEARRPEHAVQLTNLHQPDLIVFDAESDRSSTNQAADRLYEAARRTNIPIVILGTVRRQPQQDLSGQFVSKPYHYGPLIRRIESMLAEG